MRINYLYILTIALLLISCRNRSIKDVDRTVSAPQKTESLSSKIEAFVDRSKTHKSFHRQYDEICYTYIVLGNKVYEVTLVVTPELKKIVERAVLRFDENCRARYWAESTEYGFCIDSGKILIRPIPYSIFDEEDYCYWIDIPFSKNLKFKLTDTNEIIEEYRRIAYPEPQN